MLKLGQIVENYQGGFAKVVKVQEEGGLYTLSAWVRTEEQAEAETVGVIALNAFGLSQVLKGTKATEVDGAKTPSTTSKSSKKNAE